MLSQSPKHLLLAGNIEGVRLRTDFSEVIHCVF